MASRARSTTAPDLFDATTADRFLRCFGVLLQGVAAQPGQPIGELPLLAEAERHQILTDWNDTGFAYPDSCLHELFEAQAARTPGAVALVGAAGERWTYAELDGARPASGAPPAVARRRAGGAGRRLPGPLARPGGGAARGAQGRRRVRAARPGLPAGAPGLPAGGHRRARAAHRDAARCRACPSARAASLVWTLRELDGGSRMARGVSPGQPGLRDLHLGLDGPAQGCGDRAPQRRGLRALGAAGLLARGAGRRPRRDLDLLRPLGLRAVRAALPGAAG